MLCTERVDALDNLKDRLHANDPVDGCCSCLAVRIVHQPLATHANPQLAQHLWQRHLQRPGLPSSGGQQPCCHALPLLSCEWTHYWGWQLDVASTAYCLAEASPTSTSPSGAGQKAPPCRRSTLSASQVTSLRSCCCDTNRVSQLTIPLRHWFIWRVYRLLRGSARRTETISPSTLATCLAVTCCC